MWLRGQAAAVWLLALGQTLTYAGVYYAFPALLPDLQVGTGWSVAELAFGPTLGFLVMAALTPLTGSISSTPPSTTCVPSEAPTAST